MRPSRTLSPPLARPALRCALTAFGTVRADADMIAALRRSPGPPINKPFSPALLKHADEQTVVGLAAVLQAIQAHDLGATAWRDWGVLAAPRFLGRSTLVVALQRFALEGAWGVSPHLVPHRSLHSLSGTVSQALGIHGPNFGVGGGTRGAAEVMFAAAAMISRAEVPGVWVIVTGWHPELVLDPSGSPASNGKKAPPPIAIGVALAVQCLAPNWHGPRIHFHIEADGAGARTASGRMLGPLTVEGLQESLARADGGASAWRLADAGCMEIRRRE